MSICKQKVQPLILLFEGETPNISYLEALWDENEFYKPRFYYMRPPHKKENKILSKEEIMIKHNNLSILKECSNGSIPFFVLYNCTRAQCNLDLICRLIYQASTLDEELIFFSDEGRPKGECEMSAVVRCATENEDNCETRKFHLYRLYQCKTAYSYLISPCGAQKILSYCGIRRDEASFLDLISSALETGTIKGLYFYPSLFQLERDEGAISKSPWSYWWIILILIIISLILIAGIFYYKRKKAKEKKEAFTYYKACIYPENIEKKKPLLQVGITKNKIPSSILSKEG